MIFQDSYSSLNPHLSALETVAEVFRVWHSASRAKAADSARQLLEEVGINRRMQISRPNGLSGGQRQRVAIARALAAEPALLIADEPTSSLDVSVQAQILNLLSHLRERRNLALVLVSHDLSVIRHMTSDALVMYSGEVVERGSTAALLSNPRHPYTQLLVNSVPGSFGALRPVRNKLDMSPACAFAYRCSRASKECVLQTPPTHQQNDNSYFTCHHPGEGGPSARTSDELLGSTT
jgi:peptide/nickel transport system ATP-binding protein